MIDKFMRIIMKLDSHNLRTFVCEIDRPVKFIRDLEISTSSVSYNHENRKNLPAREKARIREIRDVEVVLKMNLTGILS